MKNKNIISDNDNIKNIFFAPDEFVISKENVRRIINAIKSLKPIYQDVIILNKVYGYSVDEIAEYINVPKETVKKRITRAKIKLFDALEKEELGL